MPKKPNEKKNTLEAPDPFQPIFSLINSLCEIKQSYHKKYYGAKACFTTPIFHIKD
jgi:hypothetical protein